MSDQTNKIKRIFLPTLIGFFIVILFLQAVQSFFIYINHLDLTEDGVYIFQPIFDFEVYLPLYLITLLIALAFQYFVTSRVSDLYRKEQKIYQLKPWHLVLICSLLFGIIFGLSFYETWQTMQHLLFKMFIGIMLSILYWTANLLTIYFTGKKIMTANKKIVAGS